MTERELAPLLRVEALSVHFPQRRGLLGGARGTVRAVNQLSFDLFRGETLGLVGESGCGKTTTGRAILQLIRPTAGRVRFDGHELTSLGGERLRRLRRHMQIIFQDPYASLNPRMTVGELLAEPLSVHGLARGSALTARVTELLEDVGLSRAAADRYPHEFSGGQRQRIGIARALAPGPSLIVCDEPISALDVSIQAQILNLLEALQERYALTYLFIAHDLAVVRHVSDRVAVMYLGQIVELAPRDVLYRQPLHPYTQALLAAVPVPDPTRPQQWQPLVGEPPNPAAPPPGCPFHPRCPLAVEQCRTVPPPLREVLPHHTVACHLAESTLATQA